MLKSTMKNLSETQTFMFVVMLSRSVVIGTLGSSPGAVQGTISQFQQSLQKDIATWWSEWASMWLYGNSAKGYLDPVVQYETLASVLKSVGASIFYLSPQASLPSIQNSDGVTPGPGTMGAWAVIGIVGTFGGLANLNAQIIPFWPGDWTAQDWKTITAYASGGNDMLLAPAQLIPAIWLATQGQVNNLPFANMILLPGS